MKEFAGYQIVKRINRGAMGTIYLGIQKRLGRRVAIKILHRDLALDESFISRFEGEARRASALGHRNIVTIHDFGSDGDTYYIVMEYVNGVDLKHILNEVEAFPPEIALVALKEIASGLGAAHERGIIHRDIKPANVMMSEDGEIKIADFGLARDVSQDTTSRVLQNLTVPGTILGTPAYMSPEQASARGDVDHRTDVFSLGVVAFELCSGRKPFQGASHSQIRDAILLEETPPLNSPWPLDESPIQRMIVKMLEKDPEKRHQSMRQVRRSLEECLDSLDPDGSFLRHRRTYLNEFARSPALVSSKMKEMSISRHMGRGFYYERMGLEKIDDAIREFESVIVLDPENAKAGGALKQLERRREESEIGRRRRSESRGSARVDDRGSEPEPVEEVVSPARRESESRLESSIRSTGVLPPDPDSARTVVGERRERGGIGALAHAVLAGAEIGRRHTRISMRWLSRRLRGLGRRAGLGWAAVVASAAKMGERARAGLLELPGKLAASRAALTQGVRRVASFWRSSSSAARLALLGAPVVVLLVLLLIPERDSEPRQDPHVRPPIVQVEPVDQPDSPPTVPTGRLDVRSTPPGADVELGKAAAGLFTRHDETTPTTLDLDPDEWTLRVSRTGFESEESTLVVTDGVATAWEVELRPIPVKGSIRVVTSPIVGAGVSIKEAGVATFDLIAGTTPLTVEAVAPGKCNVRVSRAGYKIWSGSVDVRAGEQTELRIDLEATLPGYVLLRLEPRGEVLLDGKRVEERVESALLEVTPGARHRIVARHGESGAEESWPDVYVDPGDTLNLGTAQFTWGNVRVTSIPKVEGFHPRVYLDDSSRGQTPWIADVSSGLHRIQLRQPGWVVEKVEVRRGRERIHLQEVLSGDRDAFRGVDVDVRADDWLKVIFYLEEVDSQ